MITSYRDLEVWKKAMDLVVVCYRASQGFPDNERYGLTSQLRRAAVSVPANIAEGRGRQYLPEFINFLFIAQGSLFELETHIQLAERLYLIDDLEAAKLLEKTAEVGRILNGLIKTLKNKRATTKQE